MAAKLMKQQQSLDTTTRIEVFTAYLRPLIQVPIALIPFSLNTTINAFCTIYISILKKCLGVVRNVKILELLSTVNISHLWELIKN